MGGCHCVAIGPILYGGLGGPGGGRTEPGAGWGPNRARGGMPLGSTSGTPSWR